MLDADPQLLLPTVMAYTEAYNHVCEAGWDSRDYNGLSLHHKTYKHCRTLLPSALTISSRVKATEALKGGRARKKAGYKVSCPNSKQCSVRYNKNAYSVWFDKDELSVSTITGRQKFGFKVPQYFNKYVDWRRKSAELFVRGRDVFISIVFEKEVADVALTGEVIGIDRGIKNIAVVSDNRFFKGGNTKRIMENYRSLRYRLRSKGTRSARRHLRRIGQKENRFRRDVDHCISKQIVGAISPGTTIVLEDLNGIHSGIMKFRKDQRYWINGWSFARLETFLKYKAGEKGCLITHVNSSYTSQKCSVCGHTERGNRTKQSLFKCKKCGFSLNADLNASRNICAKHKDAISYPCGADTTEPIVPGDVAWAQAAIIPS